MRKLLSLMAMTLFAIAGWAQLPFATPTYFEIPASPYVFETNIDNIKGAYFQNWIHSDGSWQTVASGTTQWYGIWNTETEEFVPYNAEDPVGYEGYQVRNQSDCGRRLYLYAKNITKITGFFTTAQSSVDFMIHVYNTDGTVEKEETVSGTKNTGAKVVIDGLDAAKEYKIMLESGNKNCWVQAVKFEGTPRETTEMTLANGNTATPNRIVSNFYLEQVGDMLTAQGLAEGQVLRYTTGEDPVNVASEIFPEKGYKLTVNTPVDLNLRAISGTTMTDVVTKHYELLVPEIAEDYLNIRSIKTDVLKEDASWENSVGEGEHENWANFYSETDKVVWQTTGNIQYVYHVADKYVKRTALDGTEYEIPVVAMNRANTMYFNITEPSYVKITCALEYYKSSANENAGTLNTGNGIAIDGIGYTLDEDGCITLNLEQGVHSFNIPNKRAESAFQMLEIKKGYDAMADAMLDMAKLETMQAELTQFIAGKEEYIDPDVNASIATFMGDTYQIMIGAALEEAQTNGTKYVSPIDWDNLAAIVADIKAQITANIPVVTENTIGITRTVDIATAHAGLSYINTIESIAVERTYGETTLNEIAKGIANETKLMYHGNRNIVVENNQGVAKVTAEQSALDKNSYYGVKFTVPEGKLANIERLVSCFLYDKNYNTTVTIESNGEEVYNTGKLKFNNYYNNNGRCAGDSINVTAAGVSGLTPATVEKLLNEEVTTDEAYYVANCGWTAGNNLTDKVKDLTGTVEVKLYYFGKASVFAVKDLYLEVNLTDDISTAINNAIVNTTVNGPVYNLAGQKVDANFKGIVIMNGKKVMVK